ncbi:MAG: alpha/beta hydrolase [Candidatus Omnitrophota bacterium]
MKKTFLRIGILSVVIIAACLVWLQVGLSNKTAVSKDGVKIVYSVYGKGEPTLVFVHGWCGSRSVWQKQVPYFAKKYRVIVLDLAGYGASGRQRKAYTQEAFGEDVAAVVNAAAGANKAILIGHSMSGTIILEANRILKSKVTGLIAIDTLENFEYMATPEDKIKYIEPLKKDFVKNSAPFMRDMFNKNADPKLVELVVRNVSRSNPEIAINTMEYYFDTPIIPLLSDVNVPLWCLSADLWQQYQHPEINSKYLKSYHLRIMRGVGHFLMVEAPDEFNRQLDDIIKQIINQK